MSSRERHDARGMLRQHKGRNLIYTYKGLYNSSESRMERGKLTQQLFKRDNQQQVGLARCGGSGRGKESMRTLRS